MGVLKAKVGGVWVPVGTPGPAGAPGAAGPAGPAAAKAKARGFNAYLTYPSAVQGGITTALNIGTVSVNDGYIVASTSTVRVPAGRHLISACVTVTGGAAGNWTIFGVKQTNWNGGAVVGQYDVVGQNTSTGYRMYSIAVTIDVAVDDYIAVLLTPDASPGPSIDNRSWLSISEVAW